MLSCFPPNTVHNGNIFPFSLYKASWVILESVDLFFFMLKEKGKKKAQKRTMQLIPYGSPCAFLAALWAIVNRLLMCSGFNLRYLAAFPSPASNAASNYMGLAHRCMLCVGDSGDFRITCLDSREGWAYSLEEFWCVLIRGI